MRLEDLVLVSVDDHAVEPRLVRKDSGIDVWQFMGAELPNIGLNAVAGRPPEEYAMDPQSFDDMRTGCYDIHDRVKDMNANGILGSMCFPSFPQFCGQLFARAALKDEPLAEELVRAYNDWHIESWCGAYPGRFIPLAIPMMWDVDKMAAEVRRVAEKGCFAVTFSENPVHLGHPSIHSGHWDKFFATCEELGTVVDVHITLSPMNIVQAAADFVWSKVPVQFPKLKYALSEGGIGWIPYFRERIDYTYDRHRFWTGMDRGDRLPSQIMDEQVICCWIDDPVGVDMRHKMNVDMICWECDYPHSDSSWPQSPEAVWKQMQASNCSDEDIDKITHENAMRLYKFDPFSVLGKENCNVGALREQAEGWDVSIVARGIKASATGALDLLKFAKTDND